VAGGSGLDGTAQHASHLGGMEDECSNRAGEGRGIQAVSAAGLTKHGLCVMGWCSGPGYTVALYAWGGGGWGGGGWGVG
jgi:hypothetical protein